MSVVGLNANFLAFVLVNARPWRCICALGLWPWPLRKIQGQIIGYVVGIGARYITYLVILDEKGQSTVVPLI